MLTTDEYQFEGHSKDYSSRFKLVFHCTGVEEHYDNNYTGSETFAFIHDGQLVIDKRRKKSKIIHIAIPIGISG